MDAVQNELAGRKDAIKKELEILFKANMKFTDWDVPEADDKEAAKILIDIFKESINDIEKDIKSGKYDNY